jgi:CRP/FNR family transcriptional regulator, cyclic AMP receptor protein
MPDETPTAVRESARRLIGDCRLFRGLSEARRAELVARAHVRSYGRGDTIFVMGDEGDRLMAVLDGRVRISVTSPDGREMVLAILGAGEVFGEIAVLDGRERTADATAHTACTLAVVDRRDVLALLEREPSAWLAVVELLCARLRSADQHMSEIALLDLPARLASTLLRMAEGQGGVAGEKAKLSLSQRQLGEMVGASRESVNKCISQWQRADIVRVDGAAITLLNRNALRRIAEPE